MFKRQHTVNSHNNGQCEDLQLVSSLVRVRNSGVCFDQTKFIFAWDLTAVRIIRLHVIVECPQGESELYESFQLEAC